jgi:hypothetical protein
VKSQSEGLVLKVTLLSSVVYCDFEVSQIGVMKILAIVIHSMAHMHNKGYAIKMNVVQCSHASTQATVNIPRLVNVRALNVMQSLLPSSPYHIMSLVCSYVSRW